MPLDFECVEAPKHCETLGRGYDRLTRALPAFGVVFGIAFAAVEVAPIYRGMPNVRGELTAAAWRLG